VRRVHVIGAGLAGLAAALRLTEAGIETHLHEATARAGGRAWSFHDAATDRLVDNGNHLILSGNAGALAHCGRIGSRHMLEIAPRAALPFLDLASGARWRFALPDGLSGLWRDLRLPPGTALSLGPDLARLMRAGPGATVAQTIPGRGAAWARLWEPLTLAILNAPPEHAAAQPLAATLRQSALRGGRACHPVTLPRGLGPTLVDPALALLARRGVTLNARRPLTGLESGARLTALRFGEELVTLGPDDAAILALPQEAAAPLLGLAPRPGAPILNAHFRVDPALAATLPPILGLVSGLSHWLFTRDDVVSVTISAADACLAAQGFEDADRAALTARIWADVARALGTDAPPRAARLVRARAATADPSPEARAARPDPRPLPNLMLAGGWLDPVLPDTIEAALLSGRAAGAAFA